MNRNNELIERFEMAVQGFLKDHPQLINQKVIDIVNENDDDEYNICDYLETTFGLDTGGLYYTGVLHWEREVEVDFGEYVLLNGYFSEADEDEIKKYIYNYDCDFYKDVYDELINIKDKLNYFSGIICFQSSMLQIINNEYLNRNNEVYLK